MRTVIADGDIADQRWNMCVLNLGAQDTGRRSKRGY